MRRIIIRNARLLAVPGEEPARDPQDIVIEESRIAAIGHNLQANDGEVVDASDCILLPGLVNVHLHTWQTGLRGLASNWSLADYVPRMHARVAPHFTPDDIYVATLAGALNQIALGTTALGDWFHNNLTPDHSDAAIAALKEAGIRAVLFNGTLPPRARPHPREEAQRLRGALASVDNKLLRLGLAIPGPLYSTLEVAQADLRLAREMQLLVSMHHSSVVPDADPAWRQLLDEGLFGPHVNIVHGNNLSDELLSRLVDKGVSFTVTPEVELSDGHGHPITGRLRALGAAPSLGVDIESAISGDLRVAARIALAHQRAADHEAAGSGQVTTAPLRLVEALAWVTVEGARALDLIDRIGTLQVGKEADLILIDTRFPNLWSFNDLAAAALHADLANIEGVMIAGQWYKRRGRLLYENMESLRRRLTTSGARIVQAAGMPTAFS